MRQLGDLLVWCVVVAVIAGVIYFTPRIIQLTNSGSLTFAPHATSPNGVACLELATELQ
jgi:hypothetical protein